MKVKSESEVAQLVRPSVTPWTAAYQAPPSIGFSRQEYWSGVPLPSPCEASRLCAKDSSANVKPSAEGLGAGETLPGDRGADRCHHYTLLLPQEHTSRHFTKHSPAALLKSENLGSCNTTLLPDGVSEHESSGHSLPPTLKPASHSPAALLKPTGVCSPDIPTAFLRLANVPHPRTLQLPC